MTVEQLKQAYGALCKMDNTDDGIFDFQELLLDSDNNDILKYHLNIIQNCKVDHLKTELILFFEDRRDKEKILSFLYDAYLKSTDNLFRADIIQMLGRIEYNCNVRNYNLSNHYALFLAKENISSNIRDFRYRSIIVTGWVGSIKDLPMLNDRMLHDIDGELRGYGATAMRQIWYRIPESKEKITQYIQNAINIETNDDALIGMIITIQDLYRKKLGIKESTYGETSGDVQKAKDKTIKFMSGL